MSHFNDQTGRFTSETTTVIDLESFDYLIVVSGYTGRILEKTDKDLEEFFDELDVIANYHDENTANKIEKLENRGVILVHDSLWGKKGVTKIGECNESDDYKYLAKLVKKMN